MNRTETRQMIAALRRAGNVPAAALLEAELQRTTPATPDIEGLARQLEAETVGSYDPSIPEDAQQRALLLRVERVYPECAPWLVHTPNGGGRSKRAARDVAALGVKRGVPDLLLFVRASGCIGWAAELKRTGQRPRPEQARWLEHLRGQGWRAGWFDDWYPAWLDLDGYLRETRRAE